MAWNGWNEIENKIIIYTNHDHKKPLNCLHHFLMKQNHYYYPVIVRRSIQVDRRGRIKY